jgi:hypothetical protein
VRDHERSATRHHLRGRLLDPGLQLGVDRAGRLVQDEDARVERQRPREGDELPLSHREAGATLAEQSPGGAESRPYAVTAADRGRLWFSETGEQKRLIG